jgi:hypothetical protein
LSGAFLDDWVVAQLMAVLQPAQQFSFWRLTGIDLRFELKAPDHEMHQVLPTVKDHITHQGLDIMEKRLAPGKHTP